MKTSKSIIKMNFKGGIVYTEMLRTIIDIAKKYKSVKIYFGNRQNIYLIIKNNDVKNFVKQLDENKITYSAKIECEPNIVSSYPVLDISKTPSWLTESVFDDVLDCFDFQPKLKINIVHASQNFISPFDGDLCFVASSYQNFWYLFIRNPLNNKFYCWNKLIYSLDLAPLSKVIEEYIESQNDYRIDNIQNYTNERLKYIFIEKEKEIEQDFCSYNKIDFDENNLWLELYYSQQKISVNLLSDLINECIKKKVNKIYFTTWKTILIKNIRKDEFFNWEIFLGKLGISTKYLSSEIFWKYDDFNYQAEKLKVYLTKELYVSDSQRPALVYGISHSNNFKYSCNILIVVKKFLPILPFLKFYEVYYSDNYDKLENSLVFISREYLKSNLINLLKYLYKKYYEDLEKVYKNDNQLSKDNKKVKHYWVPGKIYVCKDCYTVYDPDIGDVFNGIKPGTPFEELPNSFSCYLCSSPKENFEIKLKTYEKYEG